MAYRDLLNADGSLNRAVFEAIVAANTTHEIAGTLICRARRENEFVGRWPRDYRSWCARFAATLDQSLVNLRERAEIEDAERDNIIKLVDAMRDARAVATVEIAAERAA